MVNKRSTFAQRLRALVVLASLIASITALPFVSAAPARANGSCPATGNDTSCELLIVIDTNGTASVQIDDSQVSYDEINDAMIGILNHSSSPVYSVQVSSTGASGETATPFGFDGDGPCHTSGPTPQGCDPTINNGSGGIPSNSGDKTGYGGSLACFTSISGDNNSGTVGFAGGIPPNGGFTWFALNAFGKTTTAQSAPSDMQVGAVAQSGPSPCGQSSPPPTSPPPTSPPPTSPPPTSPPPTSPPPPQPTCSSTSDGGATTATDTSTGGDPVTRYYGDDRIGTAIAISHDVFPNPGSAQAVVLARDDSPYDALTGGPLAGHTHGPLLLTEPSGLDPATYCEIARVLPQGGTVYLLGGDAALSSSVEDELTQAGYRVVRLQGPNRFATAIAIIGALGDPSVVFEATGLDYPDALAVVPAAIVQSGGVLLTNGSSQSPETDAYLSAHPNDTRYAVGGPAAAADPSAIPVWGPTRFDTAADIASKFFSSPQRVVTADGRNFPDALAGGAAAGADGWPLILVEPTGPLPDADVNYFAANTQSVAYVILLGGPQAVGNDVENEEGYDAKNATPVQSQPNPPPGGTASDVNGTWHPDSSSFCYDAGGCGAYAGGSSTLVLNNGTWQWSSTSGTYTVRPATSQDWQSWGIDPNGSTWDGDPTPTWALVLDNWNGGTASGPIVQESNGTVDYVWVIYHVTQPDSGNVELKFGHE